MPENEKTSTHVCVTCRYAGDPIEAPDASEVMIHCLSGKLAAAGDLLEPGDSLLGPGPAEPGAAAPDSTIIAAMLPKVRPGLQLA